DGTLGMIEISAQEGITFAQDERSAKHESMPRSAAISGSVDFVLPPDGIARELLRIARHTDRMPDATEEAPKEGKDGLDQSVAAVRQTPGIDFSTYKRSTVIRRIRRRMTLHGLTRLTDYLRFLKEQPNEVSSLYQALLIRVTSFFRDPPAF